jgi:GNAT superfamily N-acetyltransferase
MTAAPGAALREPAAIRIVPYERDRHGDGPWRVVKAVFDEYGFPFDENDYDADLLHPEVHYDGRTGWFAVAEDAHGWVVGCVGLSDEGRGVFELHRLYVLAEGRRGGTGSRLVQWVIDGARARGARKLILFSDVAFEDAHRLYIHFGFRCTRFRYAPDPWQSREWGFELDLG